MKFYVASRFGNFEAVRRMNDAIQKMGHMLTMDWTKTGELGCSSHPERLGDPTVLAYAVSDKHGAMNCDVLILLVTDDMCGAYMEVGMALAMGRPVFVVGEIKRWSIFYHLPQILFFKNEWDCIQHLRKMPKNIYA